MPLGIDDTSKDPRAIPWRIIGRTYTVSKIQIKCKEKAH
jgi:hypothetical protein